MENYCVNCEEEVLFKRKKCVNCGGKYDDVVPESYKDDNPLK